MNWAECETIEINPSKLSGQPVFKGTRIPICALFENLQSGASTENFIEWFPGVTAQQVANVLRFAAQSLEQTVV